MGAYCSNGGRDIGELNRHIITIGGNMPFGKIVKPVSEKLSDAVTKTETIEEKLRKQIIIEAMTYEGMRETNGNNRAPWIDKINMWADSSLGQPYCIAGALFVVNNACKDLGLKNPCGNNPSTQSWYNNAPLVYKTVRGQKPKMGAIGIERNRLDSSRGHAYIHKTDVEDINHMPTCEFNTDGSGGRDGDGFYTRIRSQEGDANKAYRGSVDVVVWILTHNGLALAKLA